MPGLTRSPTRSSARSLPAALGGVVVTIAVVLLFAPFVVGLWVTTGLVLAGTTAFIRTTVSRERRVNDVLGKSWDEHIARSSAALWEEGARW